MRIYIFFFTWLYYICAYRNGWDNAIAKEDQLVCEIKCYAHCLAVTGERHVFGAAHTSRLCISAIRCIQPTGDFRFKLSS